MKDGVTKKDLVKSLESTLKMTRNEVESLELTDTFGPESGVKIHFMDGGTREVSIAFDSGIAIIRDVCRAID